MDLGFVRGGCCFVVGGGWVFVVGGLGCGLGFVEAFWVVVGCSWGVLVVFGVCFIVVLGFVCRFCSVFWVFWFWWFLLCVGRFVCWVFLGL